MRKLRRIVCALLGHDLMGSGYHYHVDATDCWCGQTMHSNTLRAISRGLFVAPFGRCGQR